MRFQVGLASVLAFSLLLSAAALADGPATPKARKKDSASSTAAKASPASQPAPASAPAKAKAASAKKDSNAYGWPRVELFGGYSYVRANASGKIGTTQGTFSQSTNFNGGSGDIAFNLTRRFGIAADIGGYHNGNINNSKVSGNVISYLFGPRISLRNSTAWTPFFHALFGGVHGSVDVPASLTKTTAMTFTQNAFGLVAGGGLDVNVSKHISLRTVQAEYFMTNFSAPPSAPSGSSVNRQNNFRLSTGIVFRFGERQPPPVHPPSVSCSADKNSVVQDSGDIVGVHASATNPDSVPLTYSWTATGGSVDGTAADVRWNSGGTAPGSYTVTSRVDDGRGNTTSCSADINVQPKPIPPPTMSCSVDRSTVLVGERAQVSATVNDQSGTPLTYTWQSNAGQIVGSGANVQFDTTGLGAGSYTITGRVQNGKGGAADCSTSVTVQVPPPPPQASKISECAFRAASARVDNVCKRVLDDIALRLQNDPKAKLVIVGYADPKERRPDKLAKDRAANASKYLSKEKGVADTRIEVRGAQGQKGAGKENRRADLVWVPEGASY
jgi:outer membrane protein OmpA-like peptidoglycan-associated protein